MIPTASGNNGTSTRPYLIRALHDWCTDNGFTPYIAVFVDDSVQVPREYVKNNEIVLNVGFEATSGMKLGNEYIEFKARFGGTSREITVPVDHVIAIYARENGQGMAFPAPSEPHVRSSESSDDDDSDGLLAPAGGSTSAEPAVAPGKAGGGLRLASADGQVSPVEGDEGASSPARPTAGSGGDADPEPPAPASGGGRPSLKRIK